MDFAWTDDQLALRDAVRRYVDRAFPMPQRGDPLSTEQAAQMCVGLAELGLTGLTVPQALDGAGLGAVDALVVAQELGRALVDGGFIGQTVMAASLLMALQQGAGPRAGRSQALLAAMAQGQTSLAVALGEPQQRYDWWRCGCHAQADGQGGWRLQGSKSLVLAGAQAQQLLVLARVMADAELLDAEVLSFGSEPPDSVASLAVFIVKADAPGVQRRLYRGLDGRWLAQFEFTQVALAADALLSAPETLAPAMDAMIDASCAALCGEAVGAIEVLLEMTAEHLRTRKQFGAPLAKFQVLQHRLADIAISHQQLLSMACAAAAAVDDGEPQQRRRVVSAAKALVSEQGRAIGLQVIQMFGAMGMTDECRVSHYAKRLIVIGQLLGDAAWHWRRMQTAGAQFEPSSSGTASANGSTTDASLHPSAATASALNLPLAPQPSELQP